MLMRYIIPWIIVGMIGVAAWSVYTSAQADSTRPALILPSDTAGDVARSQAGTLYKEIAPSVASIVSRGIASADGSQEGISTGSGFIISSDGYIVTNQHVVGNAQRVTVSFKEGVEYPATVVGSDRSTDLALLKVPSKDVNNLRPLVLANSDQIEPGDGVYAIGNPLGLQRTLTSGIVSGLGRSIEAPNGFAIEKVIQTDAAINPGNSGGPLLDVKGRVIGINSQIATDGAGGKGFIGIGFSVPSNTVKSVLPSLRKGFVSHAFLGINGKAIDTVVLAAAPNLPKQGVLVQKITKNGPADLGGIRPGNQEVKADGSPLLLGGDVITRFGKTQIKTMGDIISAVDSYKPGTKVPVTIVRNGKTSELVITLGERPNDNNTR